MAVITSAVTGNFSAGATWVGGVVPGPADDAVAATGTVITIDVDVTVLSFQQAGTGKFVLGNGRTVTGNVIANAGTIANGGTIQVTATTGNTATINGNITAVSSVANSIAGVVMTGSGTLTINGSLSSSASNVAAPNEHAALYTNVACTLNVNGNVTGVGANKRGIWLAPSATACQLTITGTVAGGTGGLGHGVVSDTNNSVITVVGAVNGGNTAGGIFSSGATINVTGTVFGGANANASGVALLGTTTVGNITGDVTGGSNSNAILAQGSSSVVNIVGNVVASPVGSTGSHGVLMNGVSAITNITGDVSGASGAFGVSATGASSTASIVGSVAATGSLSHGVSSTATANGVILQGNMIDSLQGAKAVYTRLFRLTATNSGTTTYTNTVGYPNGVPVTRVSPDLVTGMPATTNVRDTTIYGFNNELTGTMKVPPAGSVALGVPVDTSTGTATLDVGSVIAVVGAQVAAASSNPSVV